MPPVIPAHPIQLLDNNLKTINEILMPIMCLFFWAVALPVAGLVEVSVLIAHRVENVSLPAHAVAFSEKI